MRDRMRASAATPSGTHVQVGASSAGSELSRQVPVDLEADADLNEGWGCPGHWSSSFCRVTQGRSWRAATQGPHHTRGCADAAYSAGQFYCSRPVGVPVTCRAAIMPRESHSMPGNLANYCSARGVFLSH